MNLFLIIIIDFFLNSELFDDIFIFNLIAIYIISASLFLYFTFFYKKVVKLENWIYEWRWWGWVAHWKWILRTLDGTTYEWAFKNWSLYWKWTETKSDWTRIECWFKDWIKEWWWKIIATNWDVIECLFKNGKPEWECKLTTSDGKIFKSFVSNWEKTKGWILVDDKYSLDWIDDKIINEYNGIYSDIIKAIKSVNNNLKDRFKEIADSNWYTPFDSDHCIEKYKSILKSLWKNESYIKEMLLLEIKIAKWSKEISKFYNPWSDLTKYCESIQNERKYINKESTNIIKKFWNNELTELKNKIIDYYKFEDKWFIASLKYFKAQDDYFKFDNEYSNFISKNMLNKNSTLKTANLFKEKVSKYNLELKKKADIIIKRYEDCIKLALKSRKLENDLLDPYYNIIKEK